MRREVRDERCRSNQASSELRVGSDGGGGGRKESRRGVRESQSVRDQFGVGGGGVRRG